MHGPLQRSYCNIRQISYSKELTVSASTKGTNRQREGEWRQGGEHKHKRNEYVIKLAWNHNQVHSRAQKESHKRCISRWDLKEEREEQAIRSWWGRQFQAYGAAKENMRSLRGT